MAKRKYTLKEIKEAIEENCLIEPVMIDEISAKEIADPKLAILWQTAYNALIAIEDYFEEQGKPIEF